LKAKMKLYKWVFNLNIYLYKGLKSYKKIQKYCEFYWEKKKIVRKTILTLIYIIKFYFYYYRYFSSKRFSSIKFLKGISINKYKLN
jgi:hypothetical protein